jgi:hypothetical protein
MIAFLKRRGQALVEFALAATLIFFLLAAAVDLGFMFFALQGLHNAAQEGGSYGSRWLISDPSGVRRLDVNTIRDRIRLESGTRGGIGFVNLLDLNNNGVPDVPAGQSVAVCVTNPASCDKNPATGNPVVTDYIQVAMINDSDGDGDPLNDGVAPTYAPCANAANVTCYIRVSASFDYRLFFPLSPTFGRQRTLTSAFVMRLRDDVAREGTPVATPIFQQATATPEPDLVLTINSFYYNTTTHSVSFKAFLTLNGAPVTSGVVRATFTKGATTVGPVNLSSSGGGYYTVCNYGSFSAGGSVNASVTASSGSIQAQPTSASSSGISFDCP